MNPISLSDEFFATSRGRIHCRVTGRGKPLFLMHSNGRSAYEFDALAGFLAERYRIISWDMPGQGDSDRHVKHLAILEYANLAIEVAEQGFGGLKPVIGGASIGAAIAIAAGAEHPSRVAGAVAIELPLSRDQAWWRAHWPMVERRFSSPDQASDGVREMFREMTPELEARLRVDRHKAGAWAMMDVMWAGREDADAISDRIKSLQIPALFINGSRGVATDAADLVAALNTRATVFMVTDSGHFPHTDDPLAVANAIERVFG